jgi:sugar phosphate isomerase/epimerase
MRLAYSTLACPDWSLDRVVGAAERYGYDGIELRIIDGELVSPSMSEAQRGRVRRAMADAGLAVCCVDTSFEIADPDASIDEALGYVELAAELGGPMIRLFAGAPDGEPRSATVGRTVERLSVLAERGGSLGVTIGVETHDSFATGEILADVLSDAPRDVGVIWDTLNPIVAGEPPERTFAAIADRIVHVHIKDGAVPPDLEENRLLGEGRVPVSAIVRMLAADGYEGWLSVEWEKRWQPAIPDADVALPRYADGIRELLADLRQGRGVGSSVASPKTGTDAPDT